MSLFAGNINELPLVADVPAISRARTPAEILCINIGAAGDARLLPGLQRSSNTAETAAVILTPGLCAL